MKQAKINNSKNAAIKEGKWGNPGAGFYDKLKDCHDLSKIGNTKESYDKANKAGDIKRWKDFVHEAYLTCGNLVEGPHGECFTPFSRSGCKYPHHVFKGDELVLSIPGLKAAYSRACQCGAMKGNIKEHFERHVKELGIEDQFPSLFKESFEYYEMMIESLNDSGIDTVIFDIGSVLSEPKDGKELIKKKYPDKFTEEQLDCFVKSYYDKLEDYETASIFNAKRLYQSFLTDDIKQFSDVVFEILALSGDAYDYTDFMINKLKDKGFKLYYLSNWHKSGFEIMKREGKFNYLDKFDGGLVSYDAGCQKPDPKIYQLLIDKFKLNPSTCIFFDDKKENIDAAKKVGFKARQFHQDTVDEINDMKLDDVYKEKIEENFNFIESFLEKSAGISFDDSSFKTSGIKKNTEEESSENEDKAKETEEFVPIFGVVKSYSEFKLRNDGSEKSKSELSSVKFHKIIKRLTRGDNYSHALVSFDDTLTAMYSYEDEGFVVDNIMEKDSWMGTESIYICVMFVKKSDKNRMMRFVKNLKEHQAESKYAMANLLTMNIGTPKKVDKRFVCSSFTGYILQCSNPKNLHRDYSRLRPDDITILPRTFYVANVRDRKDFQEKYNDIHQRVKDIYNEYIDEIRDYNNLLPRIMLKDRVDKLKTFDKILDFIVNALA